MPPILERWEHEKLTVIFGMCVALLSGCNKQILDLDYNYKEVYIIDTQETIKIKSWNDYENSDMIQFTDTNGKVYLTHSSNVILMK